MKLVQVGVTAEKVYTAEIETPSIAKNMIKKICCFRIANISLNEISSSIIVPPVNMRWAKKYSLPVAAALIVSVMSSLSRYLW